jgi:hypothetical protein
VAYLVDPTRFRAEGALVDWSVVAGRLGHADLAGMLEGHGPVLQLRWMLRGDMGMPTEPFTVWHRPRKARKPQTLKVDVSQLSVFLGSQLVDWHDTMSVVEVDISGGAGTVFAFAGAPTPAHAVAFATAPGGATTLRLTASSMDGLLVPSAVTVNQVRGISADDLSQGAGWERLELVGLPVLRPEWDDVDNHSADQGLMVSLTTPIKAAVQRLGRGAPLVGWGRLLDSATPAPP